MKSTTIWGIYFLFTLKIQNKLAFHNIPTLWPTKSHILAHVSFSYLSKSVQTLVEYKQLHVWWHYLQSLKAFSNELMLLYELQAFTSWYVHEEDLTMSEKRQQSWWFNHVYSYVELHILKMVNMTFNMNSVRFLVVV